MQTRVLTDSTPAATLLGGYRGLIDTLFSRRSKVTCTAPHLPLPLRIIPKRRMQRGMGGSTALLRSDSGAREHHSGCDSGDGLPSWCSDRQMEGLIGRYDTTTVLGYSGL